MREYFKAESLSRYGAKIKEEEGRTHINNRLTLRNKRHKKKLSK